MRRLIVSGRPTGKDVDHNLIRESIIYFENTVFAMYAEVIKQIDLAINIIPNLLEDHNSTGFSCWADVHINPKQFIIEMDSKLDYKTALITLAHEFTHIKQYAMGEKQDSLDGLTARWCGMMITLDDMHYYDHPWEIEAYGREYGMYSRFNNRHKTDAMPEKIINGKVLSVISAAVA